MTKGSLFEGFYNLFRATLQGLVQVLTDWFPDLYAWWIRCRVIYLDYTTPANSEANVVQMTDIDQDAGIQNIHKIVSNCE